MHSVLGYFQADGHQHFPAAHGFHHEGGPGYFLRGDRDYSVLREGNHF